MWILCSWNCDWAKSLLHYFWLCDLLILVFATILRIPLMYLAREEISKLCLHNYLSRMSALSMALQFDEEWNNIQLLTFPSTIASVESRKRYSCFHWLPTDFFESLTRRRVVFCSLCPLGFQFHVTCFKVLFIFFINPLVRIGIHNSYIVRLHWLKLEK